MIVQENLDVCVTIPTYNEAGSIKELICSIEELRENLHVQIVIVDDNSSGGTLDIVRELVQEYGNITLVVCRGKLGLGSAIIDGFKTALRLVPQPRFVVTTDGDLSRARRRIQ